MEQTVNKLESIFTNICVSSMPYEWDENHISFLLMKASLPLLAGEKHLIK